MKIGDKALKRNTLTRGGSKAEQSDLTIFSLHVAVSAPLARIREDFIIQLVCSRGLIHYKERRLVAGESFSGSSTLFASTAEPSGCHWSLDVLVWWLFPVFMVELIAWAHRFQLPRLRPHPDRSGLSSQSINLCTIKTRIGWKVYF